MVQVMSAEEQIVDYICNTGFEDFSAAALKTVTNMLRADIGTTIAGARADGCEEMVAFCRDTGGAPEATLLLHGGLVPAQSAALANAMMSRALDFCDAIAPGAHLGSSIIPTGLACAELRGGCDGKEFLTALAIGAEIGARFNLTEAAYDGFDPTGISAPFGSVAVACRLLGLDRDQTWNALGIVFNRCGGSFQSNIDGTLSVRTNQGWVAQDAVASARVAKIGITGPQNFISGIYGYLHLYGKNLIAAEDIVGGLGREERLLQIVFKKYASCGMTQAPTDVLISMMRDYDLEADNIASIKLTLPPYGHKLVGHDFKTGDNPTVDGQFSAQYCLANILLRGSSRIRHFTPEYVCDTAINEYLPIISVLPDQKLNKRGHTAMDMEIVTREDKIFKRSLDIAPGFPGNELSEEDHEQRFSDCMEYCSDWFSAEEGDAVLEFIGNIETTPDVRELIQLLTETKVGARASVG